MAEANNYQLETIGKYKSNKYFISAQLYFEWVDTVYDEDSNRYFDSLEELYEYMDEEGEDIRWLYLASLLLPEKLDAKELFRIKQETLLQLLKKN